MEKYWYDNLIEHKQHCCIVIRGLYSSNKLNCFPHKYVWDEYPSTILILPHTWNNDVFRDKKGFWCIKITNQVISLLKGYTKYNTNLMKEHSFLHLWLRVWPWISFHPESLTYLEEYSPLAPVCQDWESCWSLQHINSL